MTRHLVVVMDPVDHIKAYKDTTVGLLREAGRRGYRIDFLEARDLALSANRPVARVRSMVVRDSDKEWC